MEFYCNVFKQSSYTYRWEGTHSSADWVWSDIDAPLVFCKGIILVGNITSCTGCWSVDPFDPSPSDDTIDKINKGLWEVI